MPSTPHLTSKRLLKLLIAFPLSIATILLLRSAASSTNPNESPHRPPILWTPNRTQSSLRIAKAILLYPPSNALLDLNLARHEAHNKAFGYGMHVLRTPIIRGYANKLIWLQHVIVEEMKKGRDEGAEWVLFFDPSSIILTKPSIPIHTFLPPISDFSTFHHLSVIAITNPATSTVNTTPLLDTSLFWIRVSPTSLNILTLGLSAVLLDPGRNWGEDIAGVALSEVLRREEYREKVLWQKEEWYLGGNGRLFARASGKSKIEKVMHMGELLDQKIDNLGRMVPGDEEIKEYWDTVIEAKQTLTAARDRGEEGRDEVRALEDIMEMRTWDVTGRRRGVEELKGALGLGEIVGWEAVVG